MTERIDDLLQQELDGCNSEEERTELLAALGPGADLEEHLAEYRGLEALMSATRLEEVPAGFTDRVMAQLPKPELVRAPDRLATPRRFLGLRLRPALALAFVVVIAVASIGIFGDPGAEGIAASGTVSTDRVHQVGDASIVVTQIDGGVSLNISVPSGSVLTLTLGDGLSSEYASSESLNTVIVAGSEEHSSILVQGSGRLDASLTTGDQVPVIQTIQL